MLFLPSAWTFEAGLPLETRFPRLWDTSVPFISGTGADTVCSLSPQCGLEEPASVSRCCTRAFCYTKRPGYGSRSRTRLTSRDFKDPGECLLHHTTIIQCFCYLASRLRYCLIMVHRILLWLHLVWMFWAQRWRP